MALTHLLDTSVFCQPIKPRPLAAVIQIAATAKTHGLIVATLNVRHFSRIPDLLLEDWTLQPT